MPSDDDKVVARLVEKFFSNGTNQHDPSTIAQRLESAIREAIQETRKRQWIPVSERLPDITWSTKAKEYVMICDEMGRRSMAWHNYDHPQAWIMLKPIGTVTHWMPLPEPPVDSKDAAEGTEAR